MMRATEWIADPNVAAYYVYHCGWGVILYRPNPLPRSWWGDLFSLWSTMPPTVEPNECRRIPGGLFIMGEVFAARVELYLNSYRLEARDRLAERRNAA